MQPLSIDDMAARQLLSMISSFVVGRAIYCATELAIADKLAAGPMDASSLAELSGCSPERLNRLMRALSAVGVFRLVEGKYALTPLSDRLRSSSERSLRPVADFFGNEMYRALERLPQVVRNGGLGWDEAIGAPMWDYLQANPERGNVFDAMMAVFHSRDAVAIAEAYDFDRYERIADVGGGVGSLLLEILRRNPRVNGVLFDSETVIENASSQLGREAAPVRARCELQAGNFFRQVPAGCDLYVLKHVLHDWDDGDVARILAACRSKVPGEARLLIAEKLIEDATSSALLMVDLGLMNNCGGKERTLDEYQVLLSGAGFVLDRVIRTEASISLLEARPH